jgi:hypothetical protein
MGPLTCADAHHTGAPVWCGVAFSPDGTILATTSETTRLWAGPSGPVPLEYSIGWCTPPDAPTNRRPAPEFLFRAGQDHAWEAGEPLSGPLGLGNLCLRGFPRGPGRLLDGSLRSDQDSAAGGGER